MRSTTSSHRRLHPCRPATTRVEAVAQLVDEGTVGEPDHLLVHVVDDGDDLVLGLKPLAVGTHPFDALAGFTAPSEWSMFGLRLRGTAHHLDGDHPPERTATTFLLGRDGEEHSILRTSHRAMPLAARARGTIPDLCRRVLALPTAPAPATTAVLWLVAWLDRVMEVWGHPPRRDQLMSSWAEVAVLHPAALARPHDIPEPHDPDQLVAAARAHAAAWPWARLRSEPDAVHLPEGHLPAEITAWMDDGFYARWALGAFPDPASLARDLMDLLEPELRLPLLHTIEGLLPLPQE